MEQTDLYFVENGTLTAVRYCNEILDQFVRPYAGAIGPDFILMDDNARPHRAHVTDAYLERETIVRIVTTKHSYRRLSALADYA